MAKRVNLSKNEKELYLKLLRDFGAEEFYQRAVGEAMIRAADDTESDSQIMDLADSFFYLYRRTGNEEYACISRVLRRVAHTVSRQLIKQYDKKPDSRFLVAVKG